MPRGNYLKWREIEALDFTSILFIESPLWRPWRLGRASESRNGQQECRFCKNNKTFETMKTQKVLPVPFIIKSAPHAKCTRRNNCAAIKSLLNHFPSERWTVWPDKFFLFVCYLPMSVHFCSGTCKIRICTVFRGIYMSVRQQFALPSRHSPLLLCLCLTPNGNGRKSGKASANGIA